MLVVMGGIATDDVAVMCQCRPTLSIPNKGNVSSNATELHASLLIYRLNGTLI